MSQKQAARKASVAGSSRRSEALTHHTGRIRQRAQPAFSNHRRLLRPKLAIGAANDRFEQEADRMASQVMRQSDISSIVSPTRGSTASVRRKCVCGGTPGPSGECEECRKKRIVGEQHGIPGIQPKLAIGATNDPLEQEADRVADQRLAAPVHSAVSGVPPRIHLNARQSSNGSAHVPASVDRVLASPGTPLAPVLQQSMEKHFGYDFSQVRVHSNAAAAKSARDVSAYAYAVGQHIVFGAGQFAPATPAGRRLLAHELTHVVQQSGQGTQGVQEGEEAGLSQNATALGHGAARTIMRKGFESTVEICQRVLETRKFEVQNGGLRVVLVATSPDLSVPNCRDFEFGVTLTRSEDWWPDNEIGTCMASTGGTRSFSFANLSAGTYYLTIWRTFDHPYCCLEGDILVFDEAAKSDSAGCRRDKDLSTMDIVHGALDIAGFIPVLGAIPDGINAGIYVVEGDWANAGLSAVAMVPAWGDGVKLVTIAGKSTIRISAKAAVKLGPEGIAKGLKEVKAASKVEKAALEATEEAAKIAKAEKEAAEGALKAEKAGAETATKVESETVEKQRKGKQKKEEKPGRKGMWGCRDVRCNVYPDLTVQPPNKNCPDRVIGEVPYVFPNFHAACTAAQVAANLLLPRGCIKRHCNCNTKCTKK
jgi:hypothetical protein